MGNANFIAGGYVKAFRAFSSEAKLYLAGSFLIGVGANLVSLLFSLYLKRLSYNEAAIGQILSVRALGSVLVALPASFFVSRLDPRRLLPTAAILAAAAYAAQAIMVSGAGIAGAVLLAGAFSTVFQVAGGPFLMRNSGSEERIHLFALNGAIGFGTGIVGSLMAGAAKDALLLVIHDEVGAYRIAIGIGALFTLAASFPFSRIRRAEAAGGRLAAPVTQIVSTPAGKGRWVARLFGFSTRLDAALYAKVLIPGFFVGMGAGLTIPYINLYFKDVFALSDTAIGVAVAAGQVFTFLGMAAAPELARRIGRPNSIVLTQGLSVPFILILTYAGAFPFVVAAYLMRQALMNLSTPLQDSFSLELVPADQQHFMNALKMLLWTLSWMVSAWISGAIIYSSGFSASFTITAVLYSLSTILFWSFFARRAGKGTASHS